MSNGVVAAVSHVLCSNQLRCCLGCFTETTPHWQLTLLTLSYIAFTRIIQHRNQRVCCPVLSHGLGLCATSPEYSEARLRVVMEGVMHHGGREISMVTAWLVRVFAQAWCEQRILNVPLRPH